MQHEPVAAPIRLVSGSNGAKLLNVIVVVENRVPPWRRPLHRSLVRLLQLMRRTASAALRRLLRQWRRCQRPGPWAAPPGPLGRKRLRRLRLRLRLLLLLRLTLRLLLLKCRRRSFDRRQTWGQWRLRLRLAL